MPDPSKILLGKPGAIEQPLKAQGGPLKPTSVVRTWKGPKAAVMALLAQVFPYFDYNYEENGPNATLQIDQPYFEGQSPEVPVNNWELLPGVIEKDLLEADLAIVNDMDADTKRIIRDAIQNPEPGFEPDITAEDHKLYVLMLAGQRAIKEFAPMLTHTQTVSNTYTVRASTVNVGRILTNATLISLESIPDNFLIAMDSPPYNYVSHRTSEPILKYGWLKHPPTLNSAYGGRQQITQQWEFGLWPILTYGVPV